MDRSSRQKISKVTVVLNDTIGRLELIDTYRTFHPKTVEYTFFPSAHGTLSSVCHILGHKTRLNKFKRIENISSSFSDHNVIKLELNYSKKYGKRTNTWSQDNMLLKNKGLNEEIKERIRKYLKTEKSGITALQNL